MKEEGFLIIDKPKGLSSFKVVNTLKRRFKFHKAGHTGTLDPFATGVLVVAVNKFTRLIQFLNEEEKTYVATVRLGIGTDTLDNTGKVIKTSKKPGEEISIDVIKTALEDFKGTVEQVPPQFSAKKVKGKSAYKYARAGRHVDLKPVKVKFFELEILDYNFPELELNIRCSKGTYIRALARDLSQKLGLPGHLTALTRTASGNFNIDRAVRLATLENRNPEDFYIGISDALSHIPDLNLKEKEEYFSFLINGVVPSIDWFENKSLKEGVYKVYRQGEFIVLLKLENNKFEFLRVINLQ